MKKNNSKKQIINSLYNIKLKEPLDYLKLGNFIILNDKYFSQIYPLVRPTLDIYLEASVVPNSSQNCYHLIYETSENIRTKAFKEKFSDHLNAFLNLLLYITEQRSYSINEYSYRHHKKEAPNLYFGGEEISFTIRSITSRDYNTKTCRLDDNIFKKTGNNKKLFEYIENEPKTELERKIKLAVSWIGQSLCNRHLDEAFMGLCVALETLLSGQNSPMERGTAYQLREFGAFLATKDKKERLLLNKELKNLYNHRCAISHSGIAKNLSLKQYHRLLKILKAIINELLIILETKNIDTHAKLQNYIDELKFENN